MGIHSNIKYVDTNIRGFPINACVGINGIIHDSIENGKYIMRVGYVKIKDSDYTYIVGTRDIPYYRVNLPDYKPSAKGVYIQGFAVANNYNMFGRKGFEYNIVGNPRSKFMYINTDGRDNLLKDFGNAILYYELATPIETPLTELEIEYYTKNGIINNVKGVK